MDEIRKNSLKQDRYTTNSWGEAKQLNHQVSRQWSTDSTTYINRRAKAFKTVTR